MSGPARSRLAVAAVAVAVAAGCAAETAAPSASDAAPSPFGGCSALTLGPGAGVPGSPAPGSSASGGAGASPASGGGASPASGGAAVAGAPADLPAVELPCFTGGAAVRLNQLRGPAVLNVWGSWCGPCRTELPMVQHMADRSAGRLTVVGVDTRDSRDAAASFGADQKISMPMLFDPEQKFLGKLGRSNVPLTVFVNATGAIYVQALPLDADTLTETVRQHTGVTVTP